MPRGFPQISTGSDLTVEQMELAHKVGEFLRAQRRLGLATPEAPITGPRLLDLFTTISSVKISDATLRAFVNYLRRRGLPVASGSGGYFYAESETELQPTLDHLRDRAAGIRAAIAGLETAFTSQRNLL